jgi:hypothetical protein
MKKLIMALLLIPGIAFANRTSMMETQNIIAKTDIVVNKVEQQLNSEKLPVKSDKKLYEEVNLVSYKDARVHATLIDGSKLMLGENSEIKLNKFLLSDNQAIGELTVLKGAFRMISGEINKQEGGKLEIKTPLATIGIRGTDFWGLQNNESLTLALIDNGVIDVTSNSGENVLMNNDMTFITINANGEISDIQELPLEVLQEAAKTVAIPE